MIGPEDSISNFGDGAVEAVPAAVPVPSEVSAASRSGASLVSAPGSEPKCYLPGWRLPCIDAGLVPVELLSLLDRLRAANDDEVRVTFLRRHPGPHRVVALQAGEAALVVTATHRLVVRRGGRPVPALAADVRRGDDVFCQSGVHRILADPVLSMRNVDAYEVRFEPDLALATFPPDVLLTMGSRAHRRRHRGAPSDLLTEDGFE